MGVYDVTLEAPIEELLVCTDVEVGQLLELDETVGKGGFATVWRAAFDGQLCACKVLQPRGGTLPPSPIVRLFIRECISLMSMDHSAVIRCAGLIRLRMVDFPQLGLTYDTYGMLLEFCEGGTLKDLLLAQLVYKQDQYSVGEALGWLAQVASALQQFHCLEMPIIHRDIKPENILLQAMGSSSAPTFWQPPPQQQKAGMPRLRLGKAGSSFRPRQQLDAKLADLGLGVRVCPNRSVLIRRRTTPVDGTSGMADDSANGIADGEEDEAIQMLFGAGGAAAAAADQRDGESRFPFMGFTTAPVKPPSRLGSNARKTSHRCSGTGIAAAAAAASAGAGDGGGAGSPCSVGDVPGSPPRTNTLHRLSIVDNIRAKLSGNRESAAGWAVTGEVAAAAGSGSPLQSPPPGERPPQPPPPPAGGASIPACGARDGGGNTGSALPATAATGGIRSSIDGPSPFRDFLQQQQQQQQRLTTCTPTTGNAVSLDASGAGATESERLTPREIAAGSNDGGGLAVAALPPPLAPAPFSLQFCQSLGHVMGHGPLAAPLAPISERSLSADDTLGGSDCRSGSGTLQASVTLTNSAATAAPLGSLQTSLSRPPTSRNTQNPILYTIREPMEDTHMLLPTAASAPAPATATEGAHLHLPHIILTLSQQHQARSPERHLGAANPNLHCDQLSTQRQSSLAGRGHAGSPLCKASPSLSPSQQTTLLGAAAASMRSSLRRAVAAVTGALSPRPSGTATPTAVAAAAALPGGDDEPPLLLQSTGSIAAPTCRIDLDGYSDQQIQPNNNLRHHNLNHHRPQQQQQQEQQLKTQSPNIEISEGPAVGQGQAPSPAEGGATSPPSTLAPMPPPSLAAGLMSRGSKGNATFSAATIAAAAASSQPLTASATLSNRPSKDRVSFRISSLVRPTLRELRHSESLGRAMRRVGSLLRALKVATLPKFRRDSQFQWVYGLTGQAGSCMYMAPEVFRGEPYNEKADVYSFGVMMYELLAKDLLLLRYIGGTRAGQELGVKEPQQFAKKACEGFRPPRSPRIPEAQWKLIQACWHPDPLVRPDMAEVASQLEAAWAAWDGHLPVLSRSSLPTATNTQSKGHQQSSVQPPLPSKGGDGKESERLNGGGGGENGMCYGQEAEHEMAAPEPRCHCIIS